MRRGTIRRLSGLLTEEPSSGRVPADRPARDQRPASTGWRRDLVWALPVLLVVALLVAITPLDGGFAATTWYPAALFALGVLAAAAAGAGSRLRGSPRSSWLAIAALAAFTAWSYASIAWAEARGDAWDGANRTLLYLIVYALCARWPSTPRTAVVAILGLAAGLAAVGLAAVVGVVVSDDPGRVFVGNRLWAPLGYPNATAALFMLVCWPAAGLASRRWLAPSARVLAFGLAALLAELSLLAESRGSVYTLPFVALVYLALVPGRLRSLAAFGVLAACIAPALGPILDVYSSDGDVEVVHRAGTALAAMLATTVVATLAGAVFVWIDRRVTVPARVQRACWAAVAVAAVVGGVALLRLTSPADEAHRAWSSFRRDGPPQSEGSHFGGFGSNRYDMWRVGLREFRGHPLAGIGADNFAIQYLQERRSDEETLYPHSLAVRVASQTGIVGVLLYAAFLAFALAAALAVRGEAARDVARLAVVGFSVWFLHGQVDWLWEMPVLGAAAAALLGLAAGLARRPAARANDSSRVGTARAVAAGGVAVALGASLALPWLSARDADRALDTWRSDPDRADALLARARALNPLSERPDMLRGVILSRRGHYEAMRESFARAVARTPSNWYANFELGVASALTGRRGEALSALERARRLNPRDELVAQIAGDVRRGRRIDPAEIDRRLLERLDN